MVSVISVGIVIFCENFVLAVAIVVVAFNWRVQSVNIVVLGTEHTIAIVAVELE